jgi:hypothetical protein
MLNVGLWDPPFAPHEGQKASKSSRSRNEGIPETDTLSILGPINSTTPLDMIRTLETMN